MAFSIGKYISNVAVENIFCRSKVTDNTMTVQTYTLQPIHLPCDICLYLSISEPWPRQDFKATCHYRKVRGQVKITLRCCTPTPPPPPPPTNIHAKYPLPAPCSFGDITSKIILMVKITRAMLHTFT